MHASLRRPTRPRLRLHPWIALLCLFALSTGCKSVLVEGNGWTNTAALQASPPYSIAVLPTTNLTARNELTVPIRQALFDGIAALPFQDVPLDRVDAAIAQLAEASGTPPDKLPAGAFALPALADCVVLTEIADVSRLYLVLYARTRIDLNLAIMDTRSRAILYRNRFRVYSRVGGPTVTVLGLAERAVQGLWNLRGAGIPDALPRAGRQIAEQLPQPRGLVAGGPALMITEAQISTPRNPLGVGDQVAIRLEATPNCRSTFSIGKLVRNAPLHEVRPGHYEGAYQVKAGDAATYALVGIKLQTADKQSELKYVASRDAFAVDTSPPVPPKIVRYWPAGETGLYLAWDSAAATSETGQAAPTLYRIQRRRPGDLNFTEVGDTNQTEWRDPDLRRGQTCEYAIIVEDMAGNRSGLGPISRITLPIR